jgi:hypothetical protein
MGGARGGHPALRTTVIERSHFVTGNINTITLVITSGQSKFSSCVEFWSDAQEKSYPAVDMLFVASFGSYCCVGSQWGSTTSSEISIPVARSAIESQRLTLVLAAVPPGYRWDLPWIRNNSRPFIFHLFSFPVALCIKNKTNDVEYKEWLFFF